MAHPPLHAYPCNNPLILSLRPDKDVRQSFQDVVAHNDRAMLAIRVLTGTITHDTNDVEINAHQGMMRLQDLANHLAEHEAPAQDHT